MLTVFSRICKKFLSDSKEINSDLPVTQGKPFSGEKKVFPGPLSKIRCGINHTAIGKHFRLPCAVSGKKRPHETIFPIISCGYLHWINCSEQL